MAIAGAFTPTAVEGILFLSFGTCTENGVQIGGLVSEGRGINDGIIGVDGVLQTHVKAVVVGSRFTGISLRIQLVGQGGQKIGTIEERRSIADAVVKEITGRDLEFFNTKGRKVEANRI